MKTMKKNLKIPEKITSILEKLKKEGFSAYIVGGCVRDILLGEEPKDWDIATDAEPEKIQEIFPDSAYENEFGTVAVKIRPDEKEENSETSVVEITTFRLEEKYSDKRHPDEVKFTKTIEKDLARRDFTVNAMAIEGSALKQFVQGGGDLLITDIYEGKNDLKNKIIRAVGNAEKRFEEDALRLVRAIRFAVQLGFSIEKETREAIQKNSALIDKIARERIRDELVKIIKTPLASQGVILLEELGLLRYIIPELREGIRCEQNKHHIYTVFEHNVRSLKYAAEKGYSFEVCFASLLHDIGKPRTKMGEGEDATFYNHEIVGAKMAVKIMERLKFPKETVKKIAHLTRWHFFYYNVGEVSESGVRRFLSKVGKENVDALLKVREADRIGSGVPKAVPYKLRHLKFMIDKVERDPILPKMLKVKGDKVMDILNIPPGPKVGWILNILLDEVLDEPKKNNEKHLEERVKILGALSDKELETKMKEAKSKKEEFEKGIEDEMKKKYYVR